MRQTSNSRTQTLKGGDMRQTSRALSKPYEQEGRGHATNF